MLVLIDHRCYCPLVRFSTRPLVYQQCELKCKEYGKATGPGMTARPQEHLFFRKLGPFLQRTFDKCNRENGLM